eukprot:8090419-Alexandrium_andersonii.AAC.1
MAYSVPYIGVDGYALSSVNTNSGSLCLRSEGTGGTYAAAIVHLDLKGFGEVELAGEARGEGNCKSSQQWAVLARVYSCRTPCSSCARPAPLPLFGAL